MALEDITKGIAYPLRFAGVWIILLTIILVSLVYLAIISGDKLFKTEKSTKTFYKRFGFIVAIAAASFILAPERSFTGFSLSLAFSILIIGIYFLAKDSEEDSEQESVSLLSELIEPYLIYCAIFLTVNAAVSGVSEAQGIVKELRYNYILTDDIKDKINTNAVYLIFLGAISDKYIFIDKSGFERFIVDESEIPSLKIHHFDRDDQASVQHLQNMLELAQNHNKRPTGSGRNSPIRASSLQP
ncbi:hypothetical protein GCM10022406_25340 [Hymenobacter algoricola]|uniref:DUF5673 domain-containing protein n=2 Tax=Hymenobacter algoricola TaxID=486267 RepID=A0ABP7N9H7_9BACT